MIVGSSPTLPTRNPTVLASFSDKVLWDKINGAFSGDGYV
jgi:hypothetical protein